MKNRITYSLAILLSLTAMTTAQPPTDRQNPPGLPPQGPPPGGPGGGFRGPPGFNLMSALDANQDGKLSSSEIDNAVAALEKLDKNQDGKLSAEEIGWPPRGGFGRGRGGFPGFGGPGEGNPRPERPGAAATGSRDDTPGTDQPSPRRRFFSVAQLQTLDENKDGKITKDEIPSGLQARILERVDTNRDEVIDQAELDKLGESQKAEQSQRSK